jgi:hypothetical protein
MNTETQKPNPTDPIVTNLNRALNLMEILQAQKPCAEMAHNIIIMKTVIHTFGKAVRTHYQEHENGNKT